MTAAESLKDTSHPADEQKNSSAAKGRLGFLLGTSKTPKLPHASRNQSLFHSLHSPSSSILEKSTTILLQAAALVSILTTLGIIGVLIFDGLPFFRMVSLKDFFFDTQWTPLLEPRHYGIWSLIGGTLMVGLGACLVAIPLGTFTALFLSEYSQGNARLILKSLLEILAGIPSVVYGFFAITFITPHLQKFIPDLEVFNALSAAIVVGVMIIPTISSLSQDAFEAVPKYLREAAYGLGARKYQVALKVVFPSALSGFMASIILGFSRAIGETMAVTLAAGSTPRLTWNFFESIQTMTAYIVQVSMGDTPTGTIEYHSIFAVGLVLFAMTFVINFASQRIVRRYQEKYQ